MACLCFTAQIYGHQSLLILNSLLNGVLNKMVQYNIISIQYNYIVLLLDID